MNPLARELVFKIVYYGPGLGGKTTTLQYVHATTGAEHRGRMVSLATPVDRTLYFDFLPIRVPSIHDMGVRLQLFTVPGQVYYNATRKLVLTGADGVVFVADSQRVRLDANLESWENLRDNLREHGRTLSELPHLLQYNKRDLPDLLDPATLDQLLNHHRAPTFATVATSGVGVYESLEAITRAVLADFERRVPDGPASVSRGLELPEGGLAEALRRADRSNDSHDPRLATNSSTEPERLATHSSSEVPSPPIANTPSGLFRLSLLPELDAGEKAARMVTEAMVASKGELVAPESKPEVSSARRTTSQAGSAAHEPWSETHNPTPFGQPAPSEEPRVCDRLSPLPGALMANDPPPRDEAIEERPPELASAGSCSAVGNRTACPVGSHCQSEEVPKGAPAVGVSFATLWPEAEYSLALQVERALMDQAYGDAVLSSEKLVLHGLAGVASLLGTPAHAPRDPSMVALLLGLPGPRVLEYRALVREARAGKEIAQQAALSAYAFAIDVRLAKTRLTS